MELVHDTPLRLLLAPGWSPLGTMLQLVPFHSSASVEPISLEEYEVPTAAQLVGLPHETPESTSLMPDMSALGTTDQLVPFHDSVKVCSRGPAKKDPAAMQLFGPVQDTATRLFSVPGSGLAMIDHVVPFHDSVSVCQFAPSEAGE
jgi:hypothetical protein